MWPWVAVHGAGCGCLVAVVARDGGARWAGWGGELLRAPTRQAGQQVHQPCQPAGGPGSAPWPQSHTATKPAPRRPPEQRARCEPRENPLQAGHDGICHLWGAGAGAGRGQGAQRRGHGGAWLGQTGRKRKRSVGYMRKPQQAGRHGRSAAIASGRAERTSSFFLS